MQRKKHSKVLKAKMALEAIRGLRTIPEIASEYAVHPTQVAKWKSEALERFPELFDKKSLKTAADEDSLKERLYSQIGQLKVELDWLKKNQGFSVNEMRSLIEPDHLRISLKRQCELLGISRSGYYYEPLAETGFNDRLMREIDLIYTAKPFYGIRRMTEQLKRLKYPVNHKRVGRLMKVMGLEAIYPRPNLSRGTPAKKYPYLLTGMEIVRPNQVWSTDITYIRLAQGFLYLVAVMDWYSRYVLSWELSNTLDAGFCVEALERALTTGRPEFFNMDQGTQFSSEAFLGRLESEKVSISMDGRGRALDNIFVERLWRSVKYENVYLHDYRNGSDAHAGLADYFRFYNDERLHQSLKYKTAKEVHFGQIDDKLKLSVGVK